MITTKYPIKIAGRLYPKGTRVRQATLEDLRKVWPAIVPADDSRQVAVWFDGMPHPTIVEKSQVENL